MKVLKVTLDTNPKISVAVHFITNSINVWAVDKNMKYLLSDINPELTDQSQLSKHELWVTLEKQIAINRTKSFIYKKFDIVIWQVCAQIYIFSFYLHENRIGETIETCSKQTHNKDIRDCGSCLQIYVFLYIFRVILVNFSVLNNIDQFDKISQMHCI